MRGFRAILVAIIGMATFMDVAPAATRADLATSRGTQSRSTTAARATVKQNTTKSTASTATATTPKTAQRNVARTIAARDSNATATKSTVKSTTQATTKPAAEARTVATRSAFMVPMNQTNAKSRTATTTKSGATRRSATGGMVLGRAGTTMSDVVGFTGGGGASDIVQVEIPEDLRTKPRMPKYLSLFGNTGKLKFNRNHLPVLKTFLGNMGISGIFADGSYATEVVNGDTGEWTVANIPSNNMVYAQKKATGTGAKTVTFKCGDGSTGDDWTDSTDAAGTYQTPHISDTDCSTPTGQVFSYWECGSVHVDGGETKTTDADITCKAIWKAEESFTVSYECNGTGDLSSLNKSYPESERSTTKTATKQDIADAGATCTRDGAELAGWWGGDLYRSQYEFGAGLRFDKPEYTFLSRWDVDGYYCGGTGKCKQDDPDYGLNGCYDYGNSRCCGVGEYRDTTNNKCVKACDGIFGGVASSDCPDGIESGEKCVAKYCACGDNFERDENNNCGLIAEKDQLANLLTEEFKHEVVVLSYDKENTHKAIARDMVLGTCYYFDLVPRDNGETFVTRGTVGDCPPEE